MIVVITSCALVRALSAPAIPAQIAPASIPAAIARIAWSGQGTPVTAKPTQAAARAPTESCPSAPMLNRPALKARATAIPAKM